MLDYNTKIILLIFLSIIAGGMFFKQFIFPRLKEKWTIVIEKNPKWVTDKLKNKYYGLDDVDILLISESPLAPLPRLRLSKDKLRLEYLIPETTSIDELDTIAHTILVCKLKVKYNVWMPNKPAFQLAILLYLLDGGDVQQEAVSWENKK